MAKPKIAPLVVTVSPYTVELKPDAVQQALENWFDDNGMPPPWIDHGDAVKYQFVWSIPMDEVYTFVQQMLAIEFAKKPSPYQTRFLTDMKEGIANWDAVSRKAGHKYAMQHWKDLLLVAVAEEKEKQEAAAAYKQTQLNEARKLLEASGYLVQPKPAWMTAKNAAPAKKPRTKRESKLTAVKKV